MGAATSLETLTQAVNKSVHQFFETMFSIKVEDGTLAFREEPEAGVTAGLDPEIVGVIGISGSVKGSVSTHHTMGLADKIGQLMLGTQVSDAEINDVAGEISNIIAGGAKNIANSLGLVFDISCPTVVRGQHPHVQAGKNTKIAYQTFKVEGHDLLVTSILAE